MMRNSFNFTTVDNSIRFPSTVNVHEHKAPVADDARLLKELEEQAMKNVILKLSETRPNKFSYNIFFTQIANADDFGATMKGAMYIVFECNGKKYERVCQCTSDIMQMTFRDSHEAKFVELPRKLQSFILFELAIIVAQVLIDANMAQVEALFSQVEMSSPLRFDLKTMREELEDEFRGDQ